jgi:hypothetical protein
MPEIRVPEVNDRDGIVELSHRLKYEGTRNGGILAIVQRQIVVKECPMERL